MEMTTLHLFDITTTDDNYDHIMHCQLRLAMLLIFNEKEVIHNLRCGVDKLILSSYQVLYSVTLV